ncbi:MAG: hypothetical protein SX243_04405 [Acidobacteriota bacterium]|nr:hypothetical protein [Acidobacteriota bacterium]
MRLLGVGQMAESIQAGVVSEGGEFPQKGLPRVDPGDAGFFPPPLRLG